MKKLKVFIIILVLTTFSLILVKIILGNVNSTIPASSQEDEIKAELSNIRIGKNSDPLAKFKKTITSDLVIYNNSSLSIGLDPNFCDYKVYVNDQVLSGFNGCTDGEG